MSAFLTCCKERCHDFPKLVELACLVKYFSMPLQMLQHVEDWLIVIATKYHELDGHQLKEYNQFPTFK